MSYQELLRHPYWQKKRLQIFNRDEWKCRRCSDEFTNLQVHHLYYNGNTMPWDYPDEAYITLCESCHLKAEFSKWLRKYGIRQLVQQGYLRSDVRELQEIIERRVEENRHLESVKRYMEDIKKLING